MNLEAIKALTTEIVESLRNINSSQSYYLDKIKPLPHTPENKELTTELPNPTGYIEEILHNLISIKKLISDGWINVDRLSQLITDVIIKEVQTSDDSQVS